MQARAAQRPPHPRTLSRWSVSAWSGVPTRISRSEALLPDPRPFSILSQLVLGCPSAVGTERRPGISIGADDAGRLSGAVSPPLSSGWPPLDILPGGWVGEGGEGSGTGDGPGETRIVNGKQRQPPQAIGLSVERLLRCG